MDQVVYIDIAVSLSKGDGKLALFMLHRDQSKPHEVEIVSENGAPAKFASGSLLSGDDLKASNSFVAPTRVAPQNFTVPATTGERTKFEIPAPS